MGENAQKLAITAIERALNDEEVSFAEMEDMLADRAFVGRSNAPFAQAAHLALHFVGDRSARHSDPVFHDEMRKRLIEVLSEIKEFP